jgi:hypothetical protein
LVGQPKSTDRILLWPSIIALALPTALVLLRASPVGPNFLYVILGMPGLLLLWASVALLAVAGVIVSTRTQAWRKAVSYAVLPIAVLVAASQPWMFLDVCNSMGDALHFKIMRAHYLSVVKAMPETGEPKLVVFNWGGMVWASDGIVYDESDEVALPPGRQSPAWRARASHTELSCDGYFVSPLGDHFYLADFPC